MKLFLPSRLVDFLYIDVSVCFCLQFKIAFAFIYYVQGFVLWRKTENKLDSFLVFFFCFSLVATSVKLNTCARKLSSYLKVYL